MKLKAYLGLIVNCGVVGTRKYLDLLIFVVYENSLYVFV